MASATAIGFAPESVHAELTDEQREISARMEREFNSRESTRFAREDEHAYHPVHRGTDDMLRKSAKRIRRQLEDIAEGELHDTKTGSRRRMLEAQLHDIEVEQEIRAALRETWQADEKGTHSYTDFKGRGGLAAVIDHGATPPSYHLAKLLDWEHFERGLAHVLDWGADA
jgi:protocatechuate 3,4-dioxygenase beta subunit